MKFLWLYLLTFVMVGCHKTNIKFPAWGSTGDIGFAMNINQLTSEDAVDCGFFDLRITNVVSGIYSKGFQCALRAHKKDRPFKFGTLTVPIDSYSYTAYLESKNGKLLQVNFDVQPGMNGNYHLLWTKRCDGFEFLKTEKQVVGINCEKITDYAW